MNSTFSTSRRKALKLGLAATLAAPAVARAQQGWPNGPITWVNPFPAGGATDTPGPLHAEAIATITEMAALPKIWRRWSGCALADAARSDCCSPPAAPPWSRAAAAGAMATPPRRRL